MSLDKIRKIYRSIFRSEGRYLSEEEMVEEILEYYARKGKYFSDIDEVIKYVEDEEHFMFFNFFS